MSKGELSRKSGLVTAVCLVTACASSGVGMQTGRLHTPRTHERKIILVPKQGGGCRVKDTPNKINAHNVDDIVWHVKNACDNATHKVEIRIKTNSGDPLDPNCDRDVEVSSGWGRIFCAINSSAAVDEYHYAIYMDTSTLLLDPDIEIYN